MISDCESDDSDFFGFEEVDPFQCGPSTQKKFRCLGTQPTDSGRDPTYAPSVVEVMSKAHLFALVRKLELSQRKAEILVSGLKSINAIASDIPVHIFRHRQGRFMQFFTNNLENSFVHCNDVDGLMSEMAIAYKPEEWRLFIDSSKSSLKAVLLFTDNTKPPVPVAYGIEMKETYETMQLIINSVQYNNHNWRLCCDLKVVALVTGMQRGWTKHACFLCNWNTHNEGNQYEEHDWELREQRNIGGMNIQHQAIVPIANILLPPLHIKLGLMKNFIKSLPLDSEAFGTLRNMFPNISYAKMKEGNSPHRLYSKRHDKSELILQACSMVPTYVN